MGKILSKVWHINDFWQEIILCMEMFSLNEISFFTEIIEGTAKEVLEAWISICHQCLASVFRTPDKRLSN
jgi:hypothetical protein